MCGARSSGVRRVSGSSPGMAEARMRVRRGPGFTSMTRTGGLADTIEDGVTGFLFRDHSMPGFMGAIKRALIAFGSHTQFTAMRRAAMNRPFGWQRSARGYGHLYGGLMKSGSAA